MLEVEHLRSYVSRTWKGIHSVGQHGTTPHEITASPHSSWYDSWPRFTHSGRPAHVDDLERAKEWYANALGVEPYFDQPFYVGFNIGGFELGLDPDMTGVTKGSNAIAYWGVKDAAASYERLLDLGAKKHRELQDVGSNIKVATMTDPFGNILGIIENPHFKFEDVK